MSLTNRHTFLKDFNIRVRKQIWGLAMCLITSHLCIDFTSCWLRELRGEELSRYWSSLVPPDCGYCIDPFAFEPSMNAWVVWAKHWPFRNVKTWFQPHQLSERVSFWGIHRPHLSYLKDSCFGSSADHTPRPAASSWKHWPTLVPF